MFVGKQNLVLAVNFAQRVAYLDCFNFTVRVKNTTIVFSLEDFLSGVE